MNDQRRCTQCGSDVSPAARFCLQYGTELTAAQHAGEAETRYKKGDCIGRKYEVWNTLGKGDFGIVYLVYAHELKSALALKTFLDQYFRDAEVRKRFKHS
jgi:serine/threonine protein kinase